MLFVSNQPYLLIFLAMRWLLTFLLTFLIEKGYMKGFY